MEKIILTRKELYDLVWSESLTALSKRFNVTYSVLRRICTKMNIPVPPNGHWVKLRFGKPITVIDLPTGYEGVNEVQISPTESKDSVPNVLTITKKSAVDEIMSDKTLTLTVSQKLTDPDELVQTAQKQLMEYKYNKYNDNGMVRYEGALTIRVSRSNIGRALRFMNTLIKLIKARGHTIEAKYSQSIYIDDEHFYFKLMEKTKKGSPDPKWGFPRFESTGLLYFEIRGVFGRIWIDGKVLIEERLASIPAKIESTIYFWKENHRINEEAKLKREEQERIIRQQRERVEKEKAAFKDLYQQAKRWQRARFMREYIKAYEQDAIEKGGLTEEVKKWVEWAGAKIGWYDPLVKKNDALLTDIDRDNHA